MRVLIGSESSCAIMLNEIIVLPMVATFSPLPAGEPDAQCATSNNT